MDSPQYISNGPEASKVKMFNLQSPTCNTPKTLMETLFKALKHLTVLKYTIL